MVDDVVCVEGRQSLETSRLRSLQGQLLGPLGLLIIRNEPAMIASALGRSAGDTHPCNLKLWLLNLSRYYRLRRAQDRGVAAVLFLGNFRNLSADILHHLLIPQQHCRSLSESCQTLVQHLRLVKSQLLLTLLTLALLQLVVYLRHGLLAAVLNIRHRGLGGWLRGPSLLDDLGDAHLVFLLPRQHCIIFDGGVLDGVVLLLLIRVAQPAFGIKTEF